MSIERSWYKRYPNHFILGTMGMSLEVRGAYSLLIDLMYERGGPIADDPEWICTILRCHGNKWSAIRRAILETGKITTSNKMLHCEMVEKSLRKARETFEKPSRNARETTRESNENNANTKNSYGYARAKNKNKNKNPLTPYSDSVVAPAPAPPNGGQAPKETPKASTDPPKNELSPEERQAVVQKILGRDVIPGRVQRINGLIHDPTQGRTDDHGNA